MDTSQQEEEKVEEKEGPRPLGLTWTSS